MLNYCNIELRIKEFSLSSQSRGIPRFYLTLISVSRDSQILSHIISFSVEAQILSQYHLIVSKCPDFISVSSHSQQMPKSYLSIISLSMGVKILYHYHLTIGVKSRHSPESSFSNMDCLTSYLKTILSQNRVHLMRKPIS